LDKEGKLLRVGLVREYERLMGKLGMEVERKLRPMEKRVDGVEQGKVKGDNARVSSLANSLDFYRKKVGGLKAEIAGLEGKNGKLKDSLKYAKSVTTTQASGGNTLGKKSKGTHNGGKVKAGGQDDKSVQVDFTIVENGEEIFSTVNNFGGGSGQGGLKKGNLGLTEK
jgi:hypothetical protein